MQPGAQFRKVWRVRNDAAVPWPPEVELVFVGGTDLMGSDAAMPVRGGVPPGGEIDVSIPALVAPAREGAVEAFWRLRRVTVGGQPDGTKFGMRLKAAIIVKSEAKNSSGSSDDAEGGAAADSDGFQLVDAPAERKSEKSAPAAPAGVLEPFHAAGWTGNDALLLKLLKKTGGNVERVHSKLHKKHAKGKVANRLLDVGLAGGVGFAGSFEHPGGVDFAGGSEPPPAPPLDAAPAGEALPSAPPLKEA